MTINWVNGFKINVSIDDESIVVISANQEGLLSLASQLTTLANEVNGAHIQFTRRRILRNDN